LAQIATHLLIWDVKKEIETKNLQLQQEIAERKKAGAELKNLEHMVKAFTGREIRMIELKKQIAKIEKDV